MEKTKAEKDKAAKELAFIQRIVDAKPNAGGVYIVPGIYTLEVQYLKTDSNRKGREFFVAEFNTLESNNPERPVGGVQSWLTMLDQDAAPGNIKGLLSAIANADPSEVDYEFVGYAISESNPMKGKKIRATATNIKTRAGTDFTKVIFSGLAQ